MSDVNRCAALVVEALDAEGLPYMLVGAYSSGAYAVPRGTKDVDFVLSAHAGAAFEGVLRRLEPHFHVDPQISFETITGSRRHILTARTNRGLQVELFLLGDDAFMQERFRRRRQEYLAQLECRVWIPTAEDVIVQKLRWARPKDTEDVRDVIAVQTLATLDMPYIEHWCAEHGTLERLRAVIESIPPDLR